MSMKKQITGHYRQPGENPSPDTSLTANRQRARLEIRRLREERIRNLNRLAEWHEKRYIMAAEKPQNRDNIALWTR